MDKFVFDKTSFKPIHLLWSNRPSWYLLDSLLQEFSDSYSYSSAHAREAVVRGGCKELNNFMNYIRPCCKMTTNQDILSFLKAEKEARETEKEQERADRQREREEDMAKIAEMIKDGVKEEVKTMLNPLDKRLEGQEKITEGLGVQMKNLVGEIEILRKEIRAGNEFPVLPAQSSGLVGEKSRGVSGGDTAQGDGEAEDVRDARIKEICSKARRILGFTPIEPRMLDIQMNSYGARDIEEAMLQEIKSYWKCEMKVEPSDIEKINIVRIFPPAKDDWDMWSLKMRLR